MAVTRRALIVSQAASFLEKFRRFCIRNAKRVVALPVTTTKGNYDQTQSNNSLLHLSLAVWSSLRGNRSALGCTCHRLKP